MRVISGLRKGHKLKAPKGMSVRPTEDRIKESLFNILRSIDEDSIIGKLILWVVKLIKIY